MDFFILIIKLIRLTPLGQSVRQLEKRIENCKYLNIVR